MYGGQENTGLLGNRPSTAQRKQHKRAELQADMQAHLASKQQQQQPTSRRNSGSTNGHAYHMQPLQMPVQQAVYQQQQQYSAPPPQQYTPPSHHQQPIYDQHQQQQQYSSHQPQYTLQYDRPSPYTSQPDLHNNSAYHTDQQYNQPPPQQEYQPPQQPTYTQHQYPPTQHHHPSSRPPSGTYTHAEPTGTTLQIARPSTADVKKAKQAQYKQELMEQMNSNAASKSSQSRRHTPVMAVQQPVHAYQPPVQPVPAQQQYNAYSAPQVQPPPHVQPIVHRAEAGNLSMFNNRPSTAQRKNALREQQRQDMADAVSAKQQQGRPISATHMQQQPLHQQYSQYQPAPSPVPQQHAYQQHAYQQQQPSYNSMPQQRAPTPNAEPTYSSAALLAREHAAALMGQHQQPPPQQQFDSPTVDTSAMSNGYGYDSHPTYQPQSPMRAQLSPTYAQQPIPYPNQYDAMPQQMMPQYNDYNNMSNTLPQSSTFSAVSPTHASALQPPMQQYHQQPVRSMPKSPSNKGLMSNLKAMHNGVDLTAAEIKAEKQRQYQAELAEQVRQKEALKQTEQAKIAEAEKKKEREIQQYQPAVQSKGRRRVQNDLNQTMQSGGTDASRYEPAPQQQQYDAPEQQQQYGGEPADNTYDNYNDANQQGEDTSPQLNTTTDASASNGRKFMSGLANLRAGLTDEQQQRKDQQKIELQQALKEQMNSKAAAKRAEADQRRRDQEVELQQIEEYNASLQQRDDRPPSQKQAAKSGGGLQHSPVQAKRELDHQPKLTANEQYKLDLQKQMEQKKQAKKDDQQRERQLDEQYEQRYNGAAQPAKQQQQPNHVDVMTSVSGLQPPLSRRVSQAQLEQRFSELEQQQHQSSTNDSRYRQQQPRHDEAELDHNSLLLELKKHADNTSHQLEMITAKLNQAQTQPPAVSSQQPTHIPAFANLPNVSVFESIEPLQYTSRLLPVDDNVIRSSTQLSRGQLQTRDTYRPTLVGSALRRNAQQQLYGDGELQRLHTASVQHVGYDSRLDTAMPDGRQPLPRQPSAGLTIHQPAGAMSRPMSTTSVQQRQQVVYDSSTNIIEEVVQTQHQRRTSMSIPLNLAAFGVTHATIDASDMITDRSTKRDSRLSSPHNRITASVTAVSPKMSNHQLTNHSKKFTVLGASAAVEPGELSRTQGKRVTIAPATPMHHNTADEDAEYPDDAEFVNPRVDNSQTFTVMNALDAY